MPSTQPESQPDLVAPARPAGRAPGSGGARPGTSAGGGPTPISSLATDAAHSASACVSTVKSRVHPSMQHAIPQGKGQAPAFSGWTGRHARRVLTKPLVFR